MGKKNKGDGRRYDLEYKNYQGKPEQIAKRSQRNKARRKLEKEGRVRKGDGRDVGHKRGVEAGNGDSNLRVETVHQNRSYPRTSKGKEIRKKKK